MKTKIFGFLLRVRKFSGSGEIHRHPPKLNCRSITNSRYMTLTVYYYDIREQYPQLLQYNKSLIFNVHMRVYVCFFADIGVQHILCCAFLRLGYPMLPVTLDSPFLIVSLVFSKAYYSCAVTFRARFNILLISVFF